MMMLSEASQAMQGTLNGDDGRFASVEIDTRRIEKDALYFAIHGESKNGHEYIAAAMHKNAMAAVADESFANVQHTRHIQVDDTTAALGRLAKHWRERFEIPVVGITGSNGKTTVCNIVQALFAEHIPGIAPQGSFNNHWGVPLTLLRLRAKHQSAVIEMGMNHAGELSYLGDIVKPSIGLITNAAAAHLEGLKTIQAVAKAKGELIDFVDAKGTVVLNRDDHYYPEWKSRAGDRSNISFGTHEQADVKILVRSGSNLHLRIQNRQVDFEYGLPGQHNRMNAAAAVAVALAAGLPLEAIKNGLGKVAAVDGRLQVHQLCPDVKLIDDSYNANQASMHAAIDVLAEQPGQTILVLGAMGELGKDSMAIHEQVGAYAKTKGISLMLTLVDKADEAYMNDMAAYQKGFGASSYAFSKPSSLVARINSQTGPRSILVKGSRFACMERIVEALKDKGGA